MSEDFETRARDVMRRAAQGMAAWSALTAYGYRVLAVSDLYDRLRANMSVAGPALLDLGSVGDPAPVAASCSAEGYPGRQLSYSVDDKVLAIGGTLRPYPDIHDFNLFMRGGRIMCTTEDVEIDTANGTVRVKDTCYVYNSALGKSYKLELITDSEGNPFISMGAIWYRVLDPDTGAAENLLLFIGPGRDVTVSARCIGLTMPGWTQPVCPVVEVPVAENGPVARLAACLKAAEIIDENNKNTYDIVSGFGYYNKLAGVVPAICEQQEGGG